MFGKLITTIIALALVPALLTGCGGARPVQAPPEETQRVSSMEGYNSRFNPAHLSSDEARELAGLNSDAIVLDVRSEESYAERHVSAAINVPFERVEEFAGTIASDVDRVIISYCFCDDKGGAALAAVEILIELGFTNVYYMEPDEEWEYAGTAVDEAAGESNENNESKGNAVHLYISGVDAKEMYDSNPGVILLDVRNQDEYDAGHIDGSVLIPVSVLEERLSELPDREAVIIVFCRAGGRSAAAYDILAANGYTKVYDMQKFSNWPGV